MPKWRNSRREVDSWLGGYDREKGSERETGLDIYPILEDFGGKGFSGVGSFKSCMGRLGAGLILNL